MIDITLFYDSSFVLYTDLINTLFWKMWLLMESQISKIYSSAWCGVKIKTKLKQDSYIRNRVLGLLKKLSTPNARFYGNKKPQVVVFQTACPPRHPFEIYQNIISCHLPCNYFFAVLTVSWWNIVGYVKMYMYKNESLVIQTNHEKWFP